MKKTITTMLHTASHLREWTTQSKALKLRSSWKKQ